MSYGDIITEAMYRNNPWWRYQSFFEREFIASKESFLRYIPNYEDRRSAHLMALRRALLERYSPLDKIIKDLAFSPLGLSNIWYPNLFYALRKIIFKRARPPLILTLRGPRQVGKTTLVKLLLIEALALRLLKKLPFEVDFRTTHFRKILYFPCDILLRGREDLHILLTSFIERAHRIDEGDFILIFLDEISSVAGWQKTVKVLYDSGYLNDTILVATGSHSIDIKWSSEVLAWRRGNVSTIDAPPDLVLMPMKYFEYVKFTCKHLKDIIHSEDKWFRFANRVKMLTDLCKGEVDEKLYELLTFIDDFRNALERYLISGGFIRAVEEYIESESISDLTYKNYADLVVKDLLKWDIREENLRRTIYSIILTLGSNVSIRKLSNRAVLSPQTVEKHIEYLAHSYALFQIFKIDINSKMPDYRKERKIYFFDPMIIYSLEAYIKGYFNIFDEIHENVKSNPIKKSIILENIVAAHLARFTTQTFKLLALPENTLFYWKSKQGEVDFIAKIGAKGFIPIEVGTKKKASRALNKVSRTLGCKGILTGQYSDIKVEKNIVKIPIEILLLLM